MKCPECDFENPADTRFCGNCGAKLTPSEDITSAPTKTIQAEKKELTIGSIFAGRYQVIEELGKGGMGKVYKVLDKDIDEKVALKLLNPEIAADEHTIKRFRNELKFARKISHKNVCRMYDLSKEEGTHYITMEYVPGEDLKSMIRMMGQLSAGKAIVVARQVCEGLVEAHRLGVVHRDLKPQNIMIDREGNSRIMDFGIARSLKAKGITGEGVIIGTPEYMSPEQVEGKEADERSDIYALGVILYEMVTGQVPFAGDTPLSIAVKHKTEAPRDPREINSLVPDDLSQVILKCMEKDTGKRYQKAEELLSELKRIEKGLPTTERILPKRKAKTVEIGKVNWKRFILYVGSALALALIIAVGIILLTGPPSAIDSIAVLPFESPREEPEMEYLCDGITESLINKLSQLPDLKVISSFSVLRYKGMKPDLEEVGRQLNVRAVLAGRVAQRGDTLSINTELINVRDNTRIWGEQYSRKFGDVLAVQDEISKQICEKLRLRLTGAEKELLAKRYTENIEAYKLYLQGRSHWNRRTRVDLQKAIDYFEKAVAVDPQYALGYASLAETYVVVGNLGWEKPSIVYPKAEAYCLKALALDKDLAEAHAAWGEVKCDWEWDFKGAEKEYQKAIQLNPNYATAYQWLAELYLGTERYQLAHEEIRKAIELDPHAIVMKAILAQIYISEERFDEAVETIKPIWEENPDFFLSNLALVMAYMGKRDYDKAQEVTEKISDPWFKAWCQVRVHAARGETTKAREILQEFQKLSQERYLCPVIIGLLYGDLGEIDEAFDLFERAVEQHISRLFSLRVLRPSKEFQQDPRYKELRKKLGLE